MMKDIKKDLKEHIDRESEGVNYVPQWVSMVSLFSVVVCKPPGILALLIATVLPWLIHYNSESSSLISTLILGGALWITLASLMTFQVASAMASAGVLADYLALIFRDKFIPRLLFNKYSTPLREGNRPDKGSDAGSSN